MKSFRTIVRSFRDALKSVVRNFSLSIASVTCITITLVIIAAAFLISENVSNFTREIEKDVTIVVFLDSDVTDEVREDFEMAIKKDPNIETFTYKSKSQVKDEMVKENDTFKNVMANWDDKSNPLKDTYTIKVHDVNKIKNTAAELESMKGVNTVQYGEGLVEKLVGVFSAIEKITYIAALALAVVTIFLIINTIKLTIFSRKREIGIMRLVGASNTRIKLPFVIEGIILGLIGSIIPVIVVVFGYSTMYDYFDGVLFSPVIKLVKPMPFIMNTSMLIVIIGMVVGMIGSALSVRRHVKV